MKNNLPLVAPSILAADYTNLKKAIRECIDGGAEWIHCDVMDGHFVPNISIGPMVVEAAKKSSDGAVLDVHLMIYQPDNFIPEIVNAGADLICVHVEATPHIHQSIRLVRDKGVKAGIAINPGTPLEMIEPVLDDVDLVLLMSVNPGFGGQKFIESTYKRLTDLRKMRDDHGATFLIQVDGGVTPDNIEKISRYGADVIVAGSSVFKADHIPSRVKELIRKAKSGKATLV